MSNFNKVKNFHGNFLAKKLKKKPSFSTDKNNTSRDMNLIKEELDELR